MNLRDVPIKNIWKKYLYYMKWEISDGTTHQLNSSLKSDFNKLGAGLWLSWHVNMCVIIFFNSHAVTGRVKSPIEFITTCDVKWFTAIFI